MQKKEKGCCKKRVMVMFPAILIMFIALALDSYAIECGFINPTNGGNINSNANLTVTVSNPGLADVYTVYINVSSATTANSSTTNPSFLGSMTNNSGTRSNDTLNLTFGSDLVLEDSNDYIFYGAVENSSARVNCNSTSTGVIVDIGAVPVAPTAITPSGTLTSNDQTFSATVAGVNTTLCNLRFTSTNPGSALYGMTHTGDTCTLSINNIPENIYNYYIEASDGTNLSQSGVINIVVDVASGGGLGGAIITTSGGGGVIATKPTPLSAITPEINVPTSAEGFKSELAPMEVTKTGVGVLGGMAIGAYLGTLVLPGIGSVSGLVIGGVLGGLGGFVI